MNSQINILHAGNMANMAYKIAKELRNNNIYCDLLMETNPPTGADPLHYDSKLGTFPDWFMFYDKTKPAWQLEIIRKMRDKKYDLIHAYVELPIFAYISRRRFIAQTQGSDLREMAFSKSMRGFLLQDS